jgi:pyruvate,water dikinase
VTDQIIWFHDLGMDMLEQVGGKNASLGEMISSLSKLGVCVPDGFATTATAFQSFLHDAGLKDKIDARLTNLDVEDLDALKTTGSEIREWIMCSPLPASLEAAIVSGYDALQDENGANCAVAVRSSATAEDLPDASFAGQQESFLNVRGIAQVLEKTREVFASLFNDRAIAYRVHQGFAHGDVAISAGIQLMARSDIGASGVLFTLDTESGFRDVVFITASWGLGEMVVQGAVNPDEFYVFKPALANGKPAVIRRNRGSKAGKMIYADGEDGGVQTVDVALEDQRRFCLLDSEIEELSRQAVTIEEHYQRPMDIEWAKDGDTGKLFILQARPETVQSHSRQVVERYKLHETGPILVEGRSIGHRIGQGEARVVESLKEMHKVGTGDVLVTDMTDPDWEPIMKRAAAIVTNRGGRTCHAAIIARELGIPAVIGCGDATEKIPQGAPVTVSCAEGDTGHVFSGNLEIPTGHSISAVYPMPGLAWRGSSLLSTG